MEFQLQKTLTTTQPNVFNKSSAHDDDEAVQQRLNKLIALNSETARQKAMFRSEQERFEAETMKNPLSPEETFAYFGLMLGTFPPLAFFLRCLFETAVFAVWIVGIFLIITLITAVVGFFSGQFLAKVIRQAENFSWSGMILILPFIGLLWGIIVGGAGGAIVFIFGAIFGGVIGGIIGFIALPLFTIFHRLLKKGEMIENKHFFPVSFGVVFAISAFILGL